MFAWLKRIPKTVWLVLAVAAAILVPFCLFGEAIDAWFLRMMEAQESVRWVSASVLFGLLALDIILPVPSSLASTWCGMLMGLWGGFLLSFMAMNVSCVLGLLLGRWVTPWAKRQIGEKEDAALRAFFAKHGAIVLLALRAVPVLAEASVLFAGIVRQPWKRALSICLLGNAAVSMIYAWVGSAGRASEAMLPAFAASMAVSGLFMLAAWLWNRTQSK